MESKQLSFNFELAPYVQGGKYKVKGIKETVMYLAEIKGYYFFVDTKSILHKVAVKDEDNIKAIIKKKPKKKSTFLKERAFGDINCERIVDGDMEMVVVTKVCGITNSEYSCTVLETQFREIISTGWLTSNILPEISDNDIRFVLQGLTPNEQNKNATL